MRLNSNSNGEMQLEALIERLGYQDSPHFLRAGGGDLESVVDYAHVFRHAILEPCQLHGVYTLSAGAKQSSDAVIPVVYVCFAETETDADEVHRLVWNQDIVPFVLVYTPRGVKLYSGFCYQKQTSGGVNGVLKTLTAFNDISEIVQSLHASAIDNGAVWKTWGKEVRPEYRLDSKLLENLRKLDSWLQSCEGLTRETSHAIIGKFVFLRYLSDRNILSDRKLESWGLKRINIFGRKATLASVQHAIQQLDEWLNGSVFPFPFVGKHAPKSTHVKGVAATFDGDEIFSNGQWQLHLDFQAYDFSYIPIETLSIIYEQFLQTKTSDGSTEARKAGAYYTPIPLVNFMLAELDEHSPLKKGKRVLDPACGSGAFLVQCYRRLIEREYPPTAKKPTPKQLRDLLVNHIYGIDRDADACRVTELSLVLTLLDYVDPPDLESLPQFKLPQLSDNNVFHCNFFDEGDERLKLLRSKGFHWIVGNPPWKRLQPNKLIKEDKVTWEWMKSHKDADETPVAGNQVAQAFVWEIIGYLTKNGKVAFLLPAMTLFDDPARKFRAAFFRQFRVNTVANFSNLAEVLFAGRSRVPAAAVFFALRNGLAVDDENYQSIDSDEFVRTFSPLVANQESTRSNVEGKRNESWSIMINASEIRDIPTSKLLSGSGLPWKIATWGSVADVRLLRRATRRYSSIGDLENSNVITMAQGSALRGTLVKNGQERTEYVQEVVGKKILDTSALKKMRNVFVFPKEALVDNETHYVRLQGGKKGLSIFRGPHIIVSAARNFSVYTDDYLVIPERQIGIVSADNNKPLLKALSLFLSSDFAFYHQFLTATQFGVKRDVATLKALRQMPCPLTNLTNSELMPWVRLHKKLVKTRPRTLQELRGQQQALLADDDQEHLLVELNNMVAESLSLTKRDRALIHDLVQVRLALIDGNVGSAAVTPPMPRELRAYSRRLKSELDDFLGDNSSKRHKVVVVFDEASGMVCVDLKGNGKDTDKVMVAEANAETVKQLAKTRNKLLSQNSQWVYFNRNLRIYDGTQVFALKPMQRFHWTESQAMFDAGEIIAETLSA